MDVLLLIGLEVAAISRQEVQYFCTPRDDRGQHARMESMNTAKGH